MNSDVQKLWVDALRGGDYEQGKNFLAVVANGAMTYCCLGVLCDLAAKAWVVSEVRSSHNAVGKTIMTYDGERFSLPASVQEWAGLDAPNPHVNVDTLAQLNDEGTPFDEIARKIEECL